MLIVLSFDPVAISRLNWFIEKINGKIVISSSWRHSAKIEDFSKQLYEIWIRWDIIWYTPDYHRDERLKKLKQIRWNEVKMWINDNPNLVDKYVIFDDDKDFLEEQKNNFIRTDSKVWLTNNDIKSALKIFINE